MIRLLLVDDQPAVRRGLGIRLHLEPDIQIVGEASTGREALSMVQALSPDVVLMDVEMPEMDGIEATAALRMADSRSAVVMWLRLRMVRDVGHEGCLSVTARLSIRSLREEGLTMITKRSTVSEPERPLMRHPRWVPRILHLLLSLVVAAGVLIVLLLRPAWLALVTSLAAGGLG
jgi:chemotaxis response regulator CheB